MLTVVLCGGTSKRLGGVDKTRQLLGCETVLDRLLSDLPPHWTVCCVGESRPTSRPVLWTREQPPGGGPVAGLAAGLQALDRCVQPAPQLVVLAGDQPFAGEFAVSLAQDLSARPQDVDAVAATDPSDPDRRAQWLLAAYRSQALRARLAQGPVADAGVQATLGSLRVQRVPADTATLLDVDTPEALERARRWAKTEG